ncbi:hypothetical protein BPAE_0159g00150 [Botrytis paeoniae]|uniref:MAT1-1-5 n=1 Tax=Botrytis paeoniae TaxID=278948 RepID=A0A4Z1FHD8_9HELO|nr:hypothetical protein BPAE_0159g00150 [Botrytis paeoniae]
MKARTRLQIRQEAHRRKRSLRGNKHRSAHEVPLNAIRTWKGDKINTQDPSNFSDATFVELAAALGKCELLAGMEMGGSSVSLTYSRYNPGVEATANAPGTPCDPAFLDTLVTDCCVLIWEFRSLYRHTDFNSMHDPLPSKYADIFHDLNTVFGQCRRLKKSPELFSTLAQERQFTAKMSRIAGIVDHLRDVIILKNDGKLARNKMREKEKELAKDLPFFYPGRADGKHPWTRWLENSSPVMPPGWAGIQQKIPHVGDNIIRRITTMYELYERQFRVEKLIDSKVNDTLDDFPAPGEAFEHMDYSRFSTLAVNYVQYKTGDRPKTDKNGMLRIEKLTEAVQRSFRWQENPVITGNANIPYHRFMMGYKVETLNEEVP